MNVFIIFLIYYYQTSSCITDSRANLEKSLVVCNQEQVCNVLNECHDNLGSGGHPGRLRTTEKVLASYHWKTLREDVKKMGECY